MEAEALARVPGRRLQRHVGGQEEDDQHTQRPRGHRGSRQPGTAPSRGGSHRSPPRLLVALPSQSATLRLDRSGNVTAQVCNSDYSANRLQVSLPTRIRT
jgi:hypothetical protein